MTMSDKCRARVVMADQHELLAASLGVVLASRGYHYRAVPVAGEPAGVAVVLRRLLDLRPDVLLVNADLGRGRRGISLIAPMAAEGVAVVVITDSVDEALWGECLAYGARAVLPKSASLAQVVSTVRRASGGEPLLEPTERTRLVRLFLRGSSCLSDPRPHVQLLTDHEALVLRLLASGRTPAQIAGVRDLPEVTVRARMTSALAKLEAVSRLTATAQDRGPRL